MKLSATQSNLQQGLSIVSRVVGNASTLPILANILFETEKGRLKLSATDLEIGVTTWVGAKVETDGSVTVPARTIVDFINTNTDEAVSLSSERDKMTVLSASFKADIPGISASEYPSIPVIEQGKSLVMGRQELLISLKSVIVAAAVDDARPALAGVLIKGNETKQLAIVATDSFRLSEYVVDLEQEVNELEIIIPQRAVHELVRILGAIAEVNKIQIMVSNNQVHFKMGDTEMVTRLIEAKYPDYKKVIPDSFVTEIVVSNEEIANALRMASIFTTNQANNVHLKINDQEVRLTSVASQFGQEVTVLEGEVMHHTEDKTLDIAFNTRYLLDAVNATAGSKIIIKFSGSTSPAVVVNPDIPKYQHIVMPIRVGS